MSSGFTIRPLEAGDIALVTEWARNEGFCPGEGDVDIYRQTDRQGLWVGCLEGEPIGCLAGVRYSQAYGFMVCFW
jgi:ribosomal-protein-alanine N-acetyltransferase